MSECPTYGLYGKPDYSHIVKDCTITIDITAAEMTAVLTAYDYGYQLDNQELHDLNNVIAKLKDKLHA